MPSIFANYDVHRPYHDYDEAHHRCLVETLVNNFHRTVYIEQFYRPLYRSSTLLQLATYRHQESFQADRSLAVNRNRIKIIYRTTLDQGDSSFLLGFCFEVFMAEAEAVSERQFHGVLVSCLQRVPEGVPERNTRRSSTKSPEEENRKITREKTEGTSSIEINLEQVLIKESQF